MTVNISAINCDDQEGPVRIVTVSTCKFVRRYNIIFKEIYNVMVIACAAVIPYLNDGKPQINWIGYRFYSGCCL